MGYTRTFRQVYLSVPCLVRSSFLHVPVHRHTCQTPRYAPKWPVSCPASSRSPGPAPTPEEPHPFQDIGRRGYLRGVPPVLPFVWLFSFHVCAATQAGSPRVSGPSPLRVRPGVPPAPHLRTTDVPLTPGECLLLVRPPSFDTLGPVQSSGPGRDPRLFDPTPGWVSPSTRPPGTQGGVIDGSRGLGGFGHWVPVWYPSRPPC